MVNQFTLVGKLVNDPEIETLEDGSLTANITLSVSRESRNTDGIYENDIIDLVLCKGISNSVKEYCHKGDVVGVRGQMQSKNITDKDGTKRIQINLVERISFLRTKEHDNKEMER